MNKKWITTAAAITRCIKINKMNTTNAYDKAANVDKK